MSLNTREINQFCKSTALHNLKVIRKKLHSNQWHWLLPEDWAVNDQNKAVLFHAINAYIEMPRL